MYNEANGMYVGMMHSTASNIVICKIRWLLSYIWLIGVNDESFGPRV